MILELVSLIKMESKYLIIVEFKYFWKNKKRTIKNVNI